MLGLGRPYVRNRKSIQCKLQRKVLMDLIRTLGAKLNVNGYCDFCVWAPFVNHLSLEIIPLNGVRSYQIELTKQDDGYYRITLDNIHAGDRYYYCFDNNKYPDPASDFQPLGVNGPSEIILRQHAPNWEPVNRLDYTIYELHVGTYTQEGTFLAIVPYLAELKNLGITAIELMPIAQFPGGRNWGYDGILPFAVQNSYGDPASLKAFTTACHQHGISVILDVVYNHLGPEGNHLKQFGPYFSSSHQTPWGNAMNVDGEYNHHVRRYFIENAIHWFVEYGFDALRLDAVHEIIDMSAYPFLEELADNVHQLATQFKRPFYLIVEDDVHDLRLLRSKSQYGFGMHAMWNDDFNYALHALLTDEKQGIYEDFGHIDAVIKAYKDGFVFLQAYSQFHKKYIGCKTKPHSDQLVIFIQNHDQIGNRAFGDRLTTMLSFEQIKLMASLLICSPYIPLIFMGEEYGETAPFQYFISHENIQLINAVRQGRCHEFGITLSDMPDPQAEETFLRCKLNHILKNQTQHHAYYNYYKTLFSIRKKYFNLRTIKNNNVEIEKFHENTLLKIHLHDTSRSRQFVILANFANESQDYSALFSAHKWQLILSSTEPTHDKPANQWLAPYGFLLFKRSEKNGK